MKSVNSCDLMQAIDGSLKRLQLEFVDLVYCHRPDPFTPIEETVLAMSDMITQGKALYWGTSEWSASDIKTAYDIADKYHLHKPVFRILLPIRRWVLTVSIVTAHIFRKIRPMHLWM